MRTNITLLCTIFAFILFSSLASAVVENLPTIVKDTCANLPQSESGSTYQNITFIVQPSGYIDTINKPMTKDGYSYNYTYCNTSQTGEYVINGCSDLSCWNYKVYATPNGERADVGTAVFYIGLLAVLLFFLGIVIYSFAHFENLLNRVGMVGIGYLLLMAITFIGWNMAKDFLTSSPFLISMLRILFLVFAIGFFPLLLGAFAWYFLMLWKIKEIQNLMEKGIPEDEAHRRVKNR